jgi:hypothetical protein
MEEYWVWCGSAIKGDDGLFHLFASRWPRALAFQPHWLTSSEVVHATSPAAVGPYEFQSVVLPRREPEHWDGMMTQNPPIPRSGDTFLVFSTGPTYVGEPPAPGSPEPEGSGRPTLARNKQRIGLATATSPWGPWKRPGAPIIDAGSGRGGDGGESGDPHDPLFTTNAAPLVQPDGSVLVVYKGRSRSDDKMRHWLARAKRWDAPYVRVREEPIFPEETADRVEDPYLWFAGGQYHALVHDVLRDVGGETDAIGYGTSPDALEWTWASPGLACSRTVRWDDGRVTRQPRVERPQLVLDGGRAVCLLVSTGDGPEPRRRGDRNTMTRAYNLAIPLAAE